MAKPVQSCKICRLRRKKGGNSSALRQIQLDDICTHGALPQKVARTNVRALLTRINRLSAQEQVSSQPTLFAQMLDMFVASHENLWISDTGRFLRVLRSTHITSPSLRHTLAAVAYAYFAQTSDDPRYVFEGRKSYGRALAALSETTNPHLGRAAQETPTSVLTSIVLIGLYQQREQACGVEAVSWTVHYLGAQQYIKACGPKGFDMTRTHDRSILVAQWTVCVFFHLGLRKRLPLGIRDWEEFGLSTALAGTPMGEWMAPAIEAPGILERLDSVVSDRNPVSQELGALAVALEANRTRNALGDWVTKWTKTTDAPELDLEIEEHIFLSASTCFRDQLWFSGDIHVNVLGSISSMICLLMDCAILRLLELAPAIAPRFQQLTACIVQQRACETADRLCRSVQYLSHQQGIVWQCAITDVLEVTTAFFSARSDMQKLAWCQTCGIALEVRSKRLAASGPQLLASTSRRYEYISQLGDCSHRLQDMAYVK